MSHWCHLFSLVSSWLICSHKCNAYTWNGRSALKRFMTRTAINEGKKISNWNGRREINRRIHSSLGGNIIWIIDLTPKLHLHRTEKSYFCADPPIQIDDIVYECLCLSFYFSRCFVFCIHSKRQTIFFWTLLDLINIDWYAFGSNCNWTLKKTSIQNSHYSVAIKCFQKNFSRK